jgi:hypothetical protein
MKQLLYEKTDGGCYFQILLGIICLILMTVIGLPAQDIRTAPVYEPENPTPLSHPDVDRWFYIPDGLQASFGSINQRYERDSVPMFGKQTVWSGTAWRGEKINLQLVLWSNRGAMQVQVIPTALTNNLNQAINSDNIRHHFVRYVLSDDAFYGCSKNTQKKPPILVADVLDNTKALNIPAKSTRPVWITINVPSDLMPGTYQGKIIIKAKGEASQSLGINLEVLSMVLPAPSKWLFELDLWQNPWAVARYHDVQPWSEEHLLLLKPLLKMLANAGQKYITTTIIHHPWNGQTYDPYSSMIKWIKRKDGNWSFDYSIFDKYVELCMECGIKKYISCYSMICFRNNTFRYYDEVSGFEKYAYAEPGTEEYIAHWKPFLTDFTRHLKDKGWLEKTLLAMDERPYELMQEILELIHSVSPKLKIALALEDWEERLHPQVYSFSVSLGRYTRPEIIQERSQKGLVSTFYPCCVEEKPNTYPHSNPAESTWMGWLAAAHEFSGFLRWAYNSWVEEPLYDTRYSQWNAGECFLVYPGPRSSIRFERLREGIQDYEKIKIVKRELTSKTELAAEESLTELNKILSRYSYQNAQSESCSKLVQESKILLEKISKYLSNE